MVHDTDQPNLQFFAFILLPFASKGGGELKNCCAIPESVARFLMCPDIILYS